MTTFLNNLAKVTDALFIVEKDVLKPTNYSCLLAKEQRQVVLDISDIENVENKFSEKT